MSTESKVTVERHGVTASRGNSHRCCRCEARSYKVVLGYRGPSLSSDRAHTVSQTLECLCEECAVAFAVKIMEAAGL